MYDLLSNDRVCTGRLGRRSGVRLLLQDRLVGTPVASGIANLYQKYPIGTGRKYGDCG